MIWYNLIKIRILFYTHKKIETDLIELNENQELIWYNWMNIRNWSDVAERKLRIDMIQLKKGYRLLWCTWITIRNWFDTIEWRFGINLINVGADYNWVKTVDSNERRYGIELVQRTEDVTLVLIQFD
jgi:hypothetical protein